MERKLTAVALWARGQARRDETSQPGLEDSALLRTHERAELEGSRTGTPVASGVEEREELDGKAETGNVLDEKERAYEI
jgi:hypothetical protein